MRLPYIGRSSDAFTAFTVLYVTAFLLEMVEYWRDPWFTAAFVAAALMLFGRIDRLRFLFLLVPSTLYFLLGPFPDVANHVNLMILVNIALIAGIAWSYVPRAGIASDAAFFEMMAPVLRMLIIATFAVAGFHKLNTDFLDPAVSCITVLSGQMWWAFRSGFLGTALPTGLVIGGVASAAAVQLWRERRSDFAWPAVDWRALVTPLVAMAVVGSILLTVIGWERIDGPKAALIFAIAIFVLCWQLVEGPMLLFRRYQWVALVFSMLVHSQLAMIRIVDFQAIAVALLATFVPANVWGVVFRRGPVAIAGLRLDRLQIYFLLNIVIGGGLMLAHYHTGLVLPRGFEATGLLFNVSVLILLWPVLSELFSKRRDWKWEGVRVFHPATPKWLFVVPLVLVLHGLTSHVGLRTAGNFSMFSNLRTEGGVSNHLILPERPLSLGGYQEDLVTIVEIDDAAARIGYQYHALQDRMLPMVEFRKLLYLWGREGRAVPIVLEYRGETVVSDDIAREPGWVVSAWDWEMRLLDFRLVQRDDAPIECRW